MQVYSEPQKLTEDSAAFVELGRSGSVIYPQNIAGTNLYTCCGTDGSIWVLEKIENADGTVSFTRCEIELKTEPEDIGNSIPTVVLGSCKLFHTPTCIPAHVYVHVRTYG